MMHIFCWWQDPVFKILLEALKVIINIYLLGKIKIQWPAFKRWSQSQAWWCTLLIPTLRRQNQVHLCEFKGVLVSSRPNMVSCLKKQNKKYVRWSQRAGTRETSQWIKSNVCCANRTTWVWTSRTCANEEVPMCTCDPSRQADPRCSQTGQLAWVVYAIAHHTSRNKCDKIVGQKHQETFMQSI